MDYRYLSDMPGEHDTTAPERKKYHKVCLIYFLFIEHFELFCSPCLLTAVFINYG